MRKILVALLILCTPLLASAAKKPAAPQPEAAAVEKAPEVKPFDPQKMIGLAVCKNYPNSSWDDYISNITVHVTGPAVLKGYIEDYKNGRYKISIIEISATVQQSHFPDLAMVGRVDKFQEYPADDPAWPAYKVGSYVWTESYGWLVNCIAKF